ncbi:hypothetical protein THIAE_08465 [Thiomicrospira aerophila AL3]|uniref:Filamentous haemagglutinin FhaB/tRNA nuclease CdiA-like TPS domain-containing protein n=1 Tax=Thiomicrospira aerophila AL3 TaxID=717772 RepID=W0DZT5_9GAMM|nr:GLUG motif-containing protein [Thiomicrospira aerophila]AHF02361.1 hypothetical protein THIAE_08465 [Thiomicrospira aerophila AL3]
MNTKNNKIKRASLNHTYRLVWSDAKQMFIAVAEIAPGKGKRKGGIVGAVAALMLGFGGVAHALDPGTLPTGGNVTHGNATINQSGNVMNIHQTTDKLITNWNSFNIGAGATVNFHQPGSNSAALNRINDTNPSQILGNLNANGNVYLINPNGILFGQNAQVDVGGLIASTLEISDQDFLNNTLNFKNLGLSDGQIKNLGNIRAKGGVVALIANQVNNQGQIHADHGNVALAAGNQVTLDFTGDGLMTVTVEQGVIDALAQNGGLIQADGGFVIMTTQAQNDIYRNVVNNTGIIQAQTLQADASGRIMLMGGMTQGQVIAGGTLDASAPTTGDGGFIETSAANVQIQPGLQVTTKAENGKTGEWLIDPTDIEIVSGAGGDFAGDPVTSSSSSIGADTLVANLANSNITLQTPADGSDDGNITVSANIVWNANTSLTLDAHNNIYVNAKIENTNISGGGVYFDALNNHSAVQFDSNGKVVIHNAEQLQWMNTAVQGTYELGSNVDLIGVTWTPIGEDSSRFTGQFDGLGNTISNLTVNKTAGEGAGLFGSVDNAQISNIHLINIDVIGVNRVGGLVGAAFNNTSIQNVSTDGQVNGTLDSTYTQVGGVVGYLHNSTITQSYSQASVEGPHGSLGGLVGYATGAASSITNSYSTGSVTSTNNQPFVGGLIGGIAGTTVSNTYATGLVANTNATNVGGLVGGFNGGTNIINNSYWDKESTGKDVSAGGTVMSSAEMKLDSTFSSWSGAGIWTLAEGVSVEGYGTLRPYLTNVTRVEDRDTASTLFNSGWGGLTNAEQTGADGSAYTITNWNQLQNINIVLTEGYDFVLSNGLNSASAGYSDQAGTSANGGKGWSPIGADPNSLLGSFKGNFDGAGFSVSDLYINRPGESFVGLFGSTNLATIKNITVSGQVIGDANVGLVVGRLTNASDTIEGVVGQAGSVTGTNSVGGLFGSVVNADLIDSVASIDVEGTADVGGLVGKSEDAEISNSYATGTVRGNENVGGLVGSKEVGGDKVGKIINSYATGDVFGGLDASTAASNIGGLVGTLVGTNKMGGQISESYATGDVTANGANVGGLVGLSGWDSVIEQSHATGNVTGINRVGGLVGWLINGSSVSQSFATGDTIGASGTDNDRFHGGLIGVVEYGANNVELSYAMGEVAANNGQSTGASTAGGLIGFLANGTVSDSYAMGDVNGRSNTGVGGLIGKVNDGAIVTNTFSTGSVSGAGSNILGGLIGVNEGTNNINNSFWYSQGNTHISGGAGEAKTQEELLTPSTFTDAGWDTTGNIWSFPREGLGAAVEGYEYGGGLGLAYLTNVTRVEDRWGEAAPTILFAGGWGDADGDGAYTITNATQLQNINLVANSGFDFELSNNIDLSGVTWTPIGNSFDNKFSGVFDGDGHTISNLEINSTGVGIGLFGWTDGATIKNVGLIDVSVKGDEFVGGLVGLLENSRVYQSYSVGGNVTASNQFVGGLVGRADSSEIEKSYSTSNVGNETNKGEKSGGLVGALFLNSSVKQSYASGNVFGSNSVGGLVGFAIGTIEQSYANGAVVGDNEVGGLVGFLDRKRSIDESYATGKVIGSSDVGGLVGFNEGNITNSYFDKTVNSGMTDEATYGKTTAELQSLATFEDGSEGWNIVQDTSLGQIYPRLAWDLPGNYGPAVWVIGAMPGGDGGSTSSGTGTGTTVTEPVRDNPQNQPDTTDTGSVEPGLTINQNAGSTLLASLSSNNLVVDQRLGAPGPGLVIGGERIGFNFTQVGGTSTLSLATNSGEGASASGLPVFSSRGDSVSLSRLVAVEDTGGAITSTPVADANTATVAIPNIANATIVQSTQVQVGGLGAVRVSLTEDGVLIVETPSGSVTESDQVTLIAIAAAKTMGVTVDKLKGVVIRQSSPANRQA